MAMTVMIIGAAAVMSMQKASVQGNLDARKTDVANNIARTWMERLQRDAMQWTCPSPACTTNNMCQGSGGALLLCNHVNGKWFLPADYMGGIPENMSPGFDILGRDLPLAELPPSTATGWPGAQFCVNVRLTYLVVPTASDPGLIRADVRVLWPRGMAAGPPAAGFCDTKSAEQDDPELISGIPATAHPFFSAIYMTTSIKENPAQ